MEEKKSEISVVGCWLLVVSCWKDQRQVPKPLPCFTGTPLIHLGEISLVLGSSAAQSDRAILFFKRVFNHNIFILVFNFSFCLILFPPTYV
jgi:hypothetical protein